MDRVEKFVEMVGEPQACSDIPPEQRGSNAISGIRRVAMAALLVAAGCGSDAPTGDKPGDGQGGDACCDVGNSADANGGVDANIGINPDISSNFIPCKVGENAYCKTQAGTMGKSAGCVDAKCTPLYDADPNSAGVCKIGDLVDGTGCDDGDKCTVDDQCDVGVCSGEDFKCEWDNDPCHKKLCDSKTGECNEPVPAGGACDDETKCTFGGKCDEDGKCQPGLFIPDTSVSCDDGDVCTQDYCEVGEGCQHLSLGITCEDDGNPCNGKEVCDPKSPTGCESINPPPDGTLCITNTNLCALESWCQEGECVEKVIKDCDDGDGCTVDFCSKSDGECQYKPHEWYWCDEEEHKGCQNKYGPDFTKWCCGDLYDEYGEDSGQVCQCVSASCF